MTTAFVDDQKRRRRSEPAALEPDGDQIVTVDAAPGTLGLVFKRDSTVLAKVLETSPLRDKVQVGWTLVSVDGEDVEMLNGWQTTRLLQAQAAAGRKLAFAVPARAADQPGPLGRVAAALSPRGRSDAAVPVVAGDVVAEVMEREAPTAGEPGEAVGSIEFIGMWKRENKKLSRLMPLKMGGEQVYEGAEEYDYYERKVRVALGRLVDELVRNKAPSGLLAIGNWTQKVKHRHERSKTDYYPQNTIEPFWGISWSAGPDVWGRYNQLGLISMRAPHGAIRFADFDGVICSPAKSGEAKNVVYRVTLPRGGLRGKWAGRPPPPAPKELYTGPRDDGLLSTEDISGEYSAPRCSEGLSMTVVPLGADAIEMWSSGCLLAPIIFLCGPKADGYIWTRKPGTNEFGRVTFSAGGTATILIHTDGEGGTRNEVYKKLPHSQKRTFQKVDARDLAGKWCGCVFSPIVLVWPFSCFTWTAKKALDEDRYEESGLRCGLCPPWSISSETYTRRYYDDGGRSYPTNWFDQDQNLPFFINCFDCDPCCGERHIAYRSSGYAVAPRELFQNYFTKKIG